MVTARAIANLVTDLVRLPMIRRTRGDAGLWIELRGRGASRAPGDQDVADDDPAVVGGSPRRWGNYQRPGQARGDDHGESSGNGHQQISLCEIVPARPELEGGPAGRASPAGYVVGVGETETVPGRPLRAVDRGVPPPWVQGGGETWGLRGRGVGVENGPGGAPSLRSGP